MRTVNDAEGHARVSLWTADRSGGPPRQVSRGRRGARCSTAPATTCRWWAAGCTGWRVRTPSARTQLRSVALAGGAVEVRTLPGAWTMAVWPWLVTAPGSTGAAVELFNLHTGARVPVRTPADRSVLCSPVWCRLSRTPPTRRAVPTSPGPTVATCGTSATRTRSRWPAMSRCCDRFEPLMTALTSTNNVTLSRLDLYDAAHRRTVAVEPAATSATAKGDYLWWSTGDNETIAWHAVDLRSLD